MQRFILCLLVTASCTFVGCHSNHRFSCFHPLSPKLIPTQSYNVSQEICDATTVQIERGKPRPIIDGIGWVVGIPNKIILWNRRVENHKISADTECHVTNYLASNRLNHVKVRLNQYRPLDDWYRLTQNKTVAWPWRYTFGTVNVLGETLFPGRIFGGDHYNPFTATIHVYSDVPAVALHEAAHAKDFSRRNYPGTYAAIYILPGVPLYHESVASRDVMAYLESLGDPDLNREGHNILYPAYGTYVGGAAGTLFPVASAPLYYAGVLGGHLAGRLESRKIVAQNHSSDEQAR